jgi:fatty-acyl-CoA synthase
MLYIGELCRALLGQPEDPRDREHGLRLAVGNGLSPDVWARFVERFAIREVHEFYAATDTPSAIVNLTSEPNSVGHVPLRRTRGFRLARIDSRTGEPLRNASGRGEECAHGEVGELLIRVRPKASAELGEVPVYTDEAASRARLLRDVFEPGDLYYRSFDRLICDRHGYFRFVERASESFRYKGENVSVSEVESVLRRAPGVDDVAVVGVKVPGVDGAPPLAAIVTGEGFDWESLWGAISALPEYARPCFVRLVPSLPLGETLKVVRRELVARGAEPRAGEEAYVRTQAGFEELTAAAWRELAEGKRRL